MRRFACLSLAACGLASPADAQSAPSAAAALPSADEIAKRDSVTIGAGAALVPDYEGSNDYRLIPAGAIRGKVSGISFISRGTYLYLDLIPAAGKLDLNAGPIVGVRFGNRHRSRDAVVKLMANRNVAIEAGGFVGLSVHGLTNPYDTLALRVDLVHDIGNAHRSTVVSPNVEFSTPLSRSTYVNLGAGLDFASNRFADYYFSVSPADRLATGNQLPLFDAGGGMKDWRTSLLLNQSLSGNLLHGLSIFGLVQYSHLVGDFKRSPIVAQRGSASQWLLAAGAAYTW